MSPKICLSGEIFMRRSIMLLSAGLTVLSTGVAFAQNATPRNLILFVPDGLRGRIVTPQTAPAMAEIRDKGVNFTNSHSLFPTFTTANASAMATGHYLGDTGDFSNTIYTGYPSSLRRAPSRHSLRSIRSSSMPMSISAAIT
jgi:predicted AlkP superfamily pyrophosphatase or phosphodiesterase